jgi:hypothetical protein
MFNIQKLLRHLGFGSAHRASSRPERIDNLIRTIRGRNLTYLSEEKLKNIAETCRLIEERNLDGLFVEAGCALGGSAILIGLVKRPTSSAIPSFFTRPRTFD